jgi:thymidylate kinase
MSGRYSYVALEGVNGAGKSFTRDMLQRHFRQSGHDDFLFVQYGWLVPRAAAVIVAFRERRGGYTTAELLDAHVADRRAVFRQVIGPNLEAGPVIGDRSLVSDAPYLEALDGVPAETVLETYLRAGLPFPDVTVYLHVDPDEAVQRIWSRGEHLKRYEIPEIIRAVAESYQRIVHNGALSRVTHVIVADGRRPEAMLPELDAFLRNPPRALQALDERFPGRM